MAKIWITGDMHGFQKDAVSAIVQCHNATESDYLIVCGDFGAEYDGHIMGSFKKEFKKFPGKIIVLRGNHDDRYWQNHEKDWQIIVSPESWRPHFLYQKKYPNIWYTRDEGDIISLGGYNFLFLPGAYSIDKNYRINNHLPYNPQEQLSWIEMTDLLERIPSWLQYSHIDFVISHTFPLSWESCYRDLFLNFIDQSQIDKNTEKFLDEIKNILHNNYIHWFGGHFHDDRELNEKATMLYNKVVEIGDYIER